MTSGQLLVFVSWGLYLASWQVVHPLSGNRKSEEKKSCVFPIPNHFDAGKLNLLSDSPRMSGWVTSFYRLIRMGKSLNTHGHTKRRELVSRHWSLTHSRIMARFQNGAMHVLACLGPNIEPLSGLNILVCACATNQQQSYLSDSISIFWGVSEESFSNCPVTPFLVSKVRNS